MSAADAGDPSGSVLVERRDFARLFEVLVERGYRVVGPTRRDGAISYEEIGSVDDLPIGVADSQDAGTYRLEAQDDAALFGHAVGPYAWKKFLYPAELRLWSAERRNGVMRMIPEPPDAPRYAFLGVRACDLRAIQIQDEVLLGGEYVDPVYRARRERCLIVGVNCGRASGTCFCVSMNSGPELSSGYDLVLTEVLDAERHYFVFEAGSEQGGKILADLPHRPADADETSAAAGVVERTAWEMGRRLETESLPEFLRDNREHARWQEIALRCLNCPNCTMVCPTCFCTTVEDTTSLTGDHAERWRKWDSCFTMSFSYVHGGSVRPSAAARYRQWMTHKLSAWHDQFGSSGCVGCGRCITWCPVGIDITEEVRTMRAGGGFDRQPASAEG
jgi:ferredoxin